LIRKEDDKVKVNPGLPANVCLSLGRVEKVQVCSRPKKMAKKITLKSWVRMVVLLRRKRRSTIPLLVAGLLGKDWSVGQFQVLLLGLEEEEEEKAEM
jgi:hypothetical protein